jgi:hypothetical protein
VCRALLDIDLSLPPSGMAQPDRDAGD